MDKRTSKRRLLKLRNFVATTLQPKNFHMATILNSDRPGKETVAEALEPSCGTVGCLAGYSYLLFEKKKNQKLHTNGAPFGDFYCRIGKRKINISNWVKIGAELLGLDRTTASKLFHGKWSAGDPFTLEPKVQKRMAVKTLDRLIKTGTV